MITNHSTKQNTYSNQEISLGPIMLDLEGKQVASHEHFLLEHPLVGGVILFARNYESSQQLHELTKTIRKIRKNIFIAVDQEGGRVQRFRQDFSRLPALGEFGKLYRNDPAAALNWAEATGKLLATELLQHDIDFSFAPVLDIDQGISQVIGDRSFSSDANSVVELARAYIKGMHAAGMMAIGKHFPGHGAVAADSHKELPIDPREFKQIWEIDLLPYRNLTSQLAGVMASHVVYSAVDANPAGFSKRWLQEILRQKIQFSGMIFSDDLSMAGAEYAGAYPERAQRALQAGCDVILICNNPTAAKEVLTHLSLDYTTVELQTRWQQLRTKKGH